MRYMYLALAWRGGGPDFLDLELKILNSVWAIYTPKQLSLSSFFSEILPQLLCFYRSFLT